MSFKLTDLNGDQHHVRFAVAMANIKLHNRNRDAASTRDDIEQLRSAMEHYIRAKGNFATVASNQTLAEVVGTWSRMERLIVQAEEKHA